jgi:hypothetical protein
MSLEIKPADRVEGPVFAWYSAAVRDLFRVQ